jgi:hypothetical protein
MTSNEGLTITNNNDESITLSYIDEGYNIYRYVIKNDAFVINFLNGNTSKMYDMLNKNDDYTVSINVGSVDIEYFKPVCLKYRLLMVNESSNDEKINMILKQLSLMNETNFLNKISLVDDKLTKLSTRIDELEDQLGNGIILPGYNGGIIDVNEEILMLNFYTRSLFESTTDELKLSDTNDVDYRFSGGGRTVIASHCKNFKFNNFTGTSLKPLRYLQNLKILMYRNNSVTYSYLNSEASIPTMKHEELLNISYLKKLECIRLVYFTELTDLDFLKKCENLKYVHLLNMHKLSNIDGLRSLPMLQNIRISSCHKIKEDFVGNVKIEKV